MSAPEPAGTIPRPVPGDPLPESQIQENMWIEIIRHMERIYGDLARTQTEMERSTRDLRRAKEFGDNVIRSMVNALVATDRWGAIELVNHAALDLFGYQRDALVRKPLKMLFAESTAGKIGGNYSFQSGQDPVRFSCGPPIFSALWNRLLGGEAVHDEEAVALSRAGTEIPVAVSGSVLHDATGDVVGVVVVVRDLRETKRLLASAAAAAEAERAKARELARANEDLRRLQDHLVQSEKMSSLGRLAAGVAHEINNPLGGIVVYAHLLLDDTPAADPRRSNIEKIVTQAMRCREIVQGLLGFARPPESGEVLLNVGRVLHATVDVFGGQALFHNVEIAWHEAESLPMVLGDAGQLQQAFSNIVLNAAQAMDGAGRLTIHTEQEIGGQHTGFQSGQDPVSFSCCPPISESGAPDEAVRVRFEDTGPGISAEDRPRLFEPFFTTKEAGAGTGLGLAISYGIVKRHGGTIEVADRAEGRGAQFIVTLPAASAREGEGGDAAD